MTELRLDKQIDSEFLFERPPYIRNATVKSRAFYGKHEYSFMQNINNAFLRASFLKKYANAYYDNMRKNA